MDRHFFTVKDCVMDSLTGRQFLIVWQENLGRVGLGVDVYQERLLAAVSKAGC
jgi:hypothetical protein